MSGWSAQTIRARQHGGPWLIYPFVEGGKEHGRSYGLTCSGYDVRIDRTIWLWPLWGRLAATVERINMPADVRAELKDKSTNARLFVTVQNTVLEPGWIGFLTVELTRHRPWPIRIAKGTPIGQLVFTQLDHPTDLPYAGKYQDQGRGPQKAILEPSTD